MSYFILLDTVYFSTLHLWYSLEYLLNLFVSEILKLAVVLCCLLKSKILCYIYLFNFIIDIELCNNLTELFLICHFYCLYLPFAKLFILCCILYVCIIIVY